MSYCGDTGSGWFPDRKSTTSCHFSGIFSLVKKINVFWVAGLKILGRVGTHILFNYFFFFGKNIILCILKGKMPFKMHKNYIFSSAGYPLVPSPLDWGP